jgi:protein-L-isoaspartate(D-aspartate) O-methyltransferase
MERVEAYRAFFARLVTSHAGVPAGSKLETAFATIPRENFVGPPPWRVFTPSGYLQAPSDDPICLYQDVVVGMEKEGTLNNGQPSLHAFCLHSLDVKEGEAVVHVGTGTGYYTAMLAQLVGTTGSVDGYEVEQRLVERAKANLAALPQVRIHHRSGAEAPLPQCDVIYVNAGATAPLTVWLDALRPNGRLLFPLTPAHGAGGMLLITRGPEEKYEAKFLCPVLFVPCVGARDAETEQKLAKAFRKGRYQKVKSLHRDDAPDGTCWCAGHGWWLSTVQL